MDEKLEALRATWKAKRAEADAIINNETATGEQIVAAGKLYDECDLLGEQIQELELKANLVERQKAADRWDREPITPHVHNAKGGDGDREGHGAAGKFQVGGFEDAGEAIYDRKTMRLIAENGAGVMGAKRWELLNSLEYKRDFALYLRKGNRILDRRSKTLQEGIDSAGGVFVPADMITRMIARKPAPTSLASYVTTLTTSSDKIEIPYLKYVDSADQYSTPFRVDWVGEAPAADVEDEPTEDLFGVISIPIYTAMISGALTNNMREDSGFPIQAWLEEQFSVTDQLTREALIVSGTGVGQAKGIITSIGTGAMDVAAVLSGAAGAIAYDGLIDIQTAIPPQYEGNARWVMNKKSTYRALNKLKDSGLRPLFSTGVNDAGLVLPRGRTLLGDPVVFSQFMPDVGATNYPIIYGDLSGYYLANRIGFSIQLLDQTKAKRNMVEVVGRVRFGGRVVEPWKLKAQKSNNS